MQPFPHPNDGSNKILLRLAHWLLRYSSLKMFTDTHTGKNEEDPIKNRGARLFTTLYINFSDAQEQITLELVAVSGRNLNSSKLSCMSSLPARMRMID